jgi:D-sedoheptulose 7-phosphate isomerase
MSENFDAVQHARAEMQSLSRLAAVAGQELAEPTVRIAALVTGVLRNGGKLLFCGNGGSAAEAQHLAAEYVVRFRRTRPGLAALALTTDASVLTAASNDDGYETVFARQVQALGRPEDVLFLHSTSGNSANLVKAAEAARELQVTTVGILAKGGGALAPLVDESLIVPTDDTARAQEIHLALGHVICDLVERALEREESA